MQKCPQIHVFSFTFFLLLLQTHVLSESQLASSSESKTLLEIQKQLQYPQILQSWTDTTNFCRIRPSHSFRIVCFKGHVTELSITGNRTSKLSGSFHKLFTLLTQLSSLNTLSLTSLGISGSLSPKIITKLSPSLESLNLSSNFISGKIPAEIASLKKLRSLVLTDNMFWGFVSDDLRGLSNLQELELGGNKLGPTVPSLPSKLISVSLKNNSFRSKIPEQIKKMNKLQSLDLSSNQFTGSIPEFLFSLPSLQFLSLDQNMLSGSLPDSSCRSSKIRTFDVSHNLLTGKLPSCYSSKTFRNQTVLFSFNCLSLTGTPNAKYQRPLSFCQNQASKAIAVKPIPKVKEKDSTRIKLGLVILIIISAVILAAILVLLILIALKKRKSRSEENHSEVTNNNNERHASDKVSVCSTTTTSSKSLPDSKRVPHTMRSAVIGLPPYRVFSLEELEEATNDFDAASLFAEQLYTGCLREGIPVTVQCIKLKQKSLPQSLAQQMEVLSKLRHMHLVSVLGHCIASNQDHNQHSGHTIFIVQEYISSGSLRDFLTNCRKKEVLKWPQRMAIAIGVARGIQFLHMGVAPGIFGNNLKIENIMLDETLTVKISGYTIPLPTKVGEESPQAKNPRSNEDREKEDVYQFGVILLQIITGKVVVSGSSEMGSLKLQLENGLRDEPSVLSSLADPSVKGSYAYESLRTTVEFAINCLCEDQTKRPSIEDVVWNLQYTIQVQQGWRPSSGNHESSMKAIYE
ncbi:PREDICTED: probable LRR receptor-like serine/threonine-protein kinase At2g02780 [Camelina sativa]|uniref:Probable LRR receptor-like serine/threonine-protein kinase At2g02780 n=1 Tax=Camelina sativa TaxID=90675 RepID=A0ABM0ZD28_CAMSA|nr:PREDICTED: probable LRR receptor-like serine/threonine-protein kinase At2g02780 [Camelina sativa]